MPRVHFSDADEMLERIITELRDEPIPEFEDPLPAKPTAAIEEVHRRPHPSGTVRIGRRTSWIRVVAVTVGILVVVSVMFFDSPIGRVGGTNIAFAQIQEAVSSTKSLRCRVLDYHGDRDPYVSSGVSVVGVGSRGEGSDGSETITNLQARRILWMNHRNRTARIMQLYLKDNDDWGGDVFTQKIRNLAASGAKDLGPAILNGKEVLRFGFWNDGDFIVSVDPATKLPVRMELTIEKGSAGGKTFREVYTDFVFDSAVDESLFEIKVPAGYTVVRCEEPQDRKPVDTRNITVSTTNGFGPVRLGSSKDQVVAAFGTPDLIEEIFRVGGPRPSPAAPPIAGPETVVERLNYSSLGFAVSVSSSDGATGFECFGRLHQGNLARDFDGKTDANIRLGSSIDDVLKAYGKPDVRTAQRQDALYYFHKGWTFLFNGGKLAQFSISKPESEETEIVDNGDGTWTTSLKEKKGP